MNTLFYIEKSGDFKGGDWTSSNIIQSADGFILMQSVYY